jgi:hypothetical protein
MADAEVDQPASSAEPGPPADPARDPRTEAEPESPSTRSMLQDVASTIADAAGPVISAARAPVGQFASGARRMLGERSGARVRRVRAMGRAPLANLWEVHLDARLASIRELGLQTVPVERIVGTAVEGPAQRGGDFLPLRDRRSTDWRARWQRILNAVDQLHNLPPVELVKFGDQYWVVDGHNRVAAALYTGQVALDASVLELRLPGMASSAAPSTVAPMLEGSRELRAAGTGRLSRRTSLPTDAPLTRVEPIGESDGAGPGDAGQEE